MKELNQERLRDLFESIVTLARLGASLSKTHVTLDENTAIKQIRILLIKPLIQNQPEIKDYDVELLAAIFHKVYQKETKRQGDIRHKDEYMDLPENIKDFDRVLARYVLQNFKSRPEITMKDIEGWADEARERVTNHDWSYLADVIKDMIEEEFGIKVKK